MCAVSVSIASIASFITAGSSFPHRSSMCAYPWITAIGVRSSWLASSTNRICFFCDAASRFSILLTAASSPDSSLSRTLIRASPDRSSMWSSAVSMS